MHQTSARVHHNPENNSFGAGSSIPVTSIPASANGPSSYPNVSIGSNMNCGTEVNALSEELRVAVEECQSERVIELLKRGAPSVLDGEGQTPLHLAAAAGNLELVDALIQAGCDVTVQDFTGHTALQRAAAEGHVPVIKTLLENGVSVDHQDEVHGNTALHESSWKGFSQSVNVLCKAKANAYIKNRGGFAPLHLCCQNGHNETCRVLLLAGCKPDIKNNYGDTPLHTSARYGHAGVIRILVSAKCNPSEQNKNGDTALHIAAAMGRRKLTRVLLESGCNQGIKNKQHETALEIARRKNLGEIIRIIENPPSLLVQSRLQVSGAEGRSSREGANTNGILHDGYDPLHDTTFNYEFDPDDLDDPEEDVDGIRRDPSYPYHPMDISKDSHPKQHDPHQKYHHYPSYTNHQPSTRDGKPKHNRSSDSSRENIRRNNIHQKSSHNPSQQKKQRNDGKYHIPQKPSTGAFESMPRKRDSRLLDSRGGDKRRQTRNVDNHQKSKSREFRKSTYIPSPYHDGDDFGQEKNNNGLIKNHTKLMDQIMDDLIAEATDNEGQYYLDLAGNVRKDITPKKRRDVSGRNGTGKGCHCGNAFSKIEKKLEKDKGDLIRVIDQSQSKLESKLIHLERKTRDQLFGLNQAMKESLAAERGECLDRMDRRALRERMAIERQQVLRDVALKRDLAVWLDARLTEIEKQHNLDSKNAALLRTMAVKRFTKHKKSGSRGRSLDANAGNANGSLRRAHSEEMLSELDLNIIGSSGNGDKSERKNTSHKSSGTNGEKYPELSQNGDLSSTEIDEDDDILQYKYKNQGQSLCVSDLPRTRRNSDHNGTSNGTQSMSLPHSTNLSGDPLSSYSLQYDHNQGYTHDKGHRRSVNNEFQQSNEMNNAANSSKIASPLATSEQIFMPNGILTTTLAMGQTPIESRKEKLDDFPGLMDIETTQLNPELYSLQSNDDVDVMMTSSASLQLHHLHKFDQNQNLEVSSRPTNNYYGSSSNNDIYSNQHIVNGTQQKENLISPEKRLDFVVSSACEVTPTDHINMSDPSLSHNYNNVSFARSNNTVCSMNYFSNLEHSNYYDNHVSNQAGECYEQASENSVSSSQGNIDQRQMNTIQMVRPIPKFTTFGNGNHTASKSNYTPSNNGYHSQGISLPKGIHSGSEEDLHRALPIYLPSEGDSVSSLSCTSVNDLHLGHAGSSLVQQLNDFSNLSLQCENQMNYRQQLINATERHLNHYPSAGDENGSSLHLSNFATQRAQMQSNTHDDVQNQQQNKPPPLPARLHPPSHSPHQNQQSPNSLTFFPPVIHQFPGRSVKPMLAPLDEGDYSPVDDDYSTNNNESSSTIIGKVQKTAEKFNSIINNQKLSNTSINNCEKDISSKAIHPISNSVSLDIQNGKNIKELIGNGNLDSNADSGIGQLSSNSLSGTSVSGSISSSNSSSSTSPQDSHNDSGYSTRIGYSAGPSPSLSVSRPQSSEGDHTQTAHQQNGYTIRVPPVSSSVVASEPTDKTNKLDGSSSDSGLLIDQLGIDLTHSELQQLHSTSDSALMSLHEKGITNGLNTAKGNSNLNLFQGIKIETNGFGPRGSLV